MPCEQKQTTRVDNYRVRRAAGHVQNLENARLEKLNKQVFETKGISVTEFSRRINKSRENMYSIFSRKTIDSGLLLAISRVLEFDFFKLYSKNNYVLQEEVQKLREENQILKDYTALLREQKGQ